MLWQCTSSLSLWIAQLFFKELVSIYSLSKSLCELPLTLILGNLIFSKMQCVKWYFIVVSIYSAFNTGEGDHLPLCISVIWGFSLFLCLYIFLVNFSIWWCVFSYWFVCLTVLLPLGDAVLLGNSKGRESYLSLDCYQLKPNYHIAGRELPSFPSRRSRCNE